MTLRRRVVLSNEPLTNFSIDLLMRFEQKTDDIVIVYMDKYDWSYRQSQEEGK